MSRTREQYPLSTKKIIKKTITSSLIFIILAVIFMFCSVTYLVSGAPASIWVILLIVMLIGFVLFVVLAYFYQRWYFATYFYDLTADYVIIRKGPITPKEITIPYERIQDVYVDQDILDRLFGLYDVHISTATISSGMAAHIDGAESAAAEGLRKILLDRVQEKVGSRPVAAPAAITTK